MAKIINIKKSADFKITMNLGKKFVCSSFIVFFYKNNSLNNTTKVGFTVSSKVGNAVVRNRIKRRLRALSYCMFSENDCGNFMVCFVGRKHCYNVDFANMKKDLQNAIKKISA